MELLFSMSGIFLTNVLVLMMIDMLLTARSILRTTHIRRLRDSLNQDLQHCCRQAQDAVSPAQS